MEVWHGSLIPNAFGLAPVLEGISPGNYDIYIVRCAYCNRKELIGGTTNTNTLRTYLCTGVQDAQINVVLIPAATTS